MDNILPSIPKYRAWSYKHNEMRKVVWLDWLDSWTIRANLTSSSNFWEPHLIMPDYEWKPLVEFDLVEYTWMNDRNGNEIYWGDIVLDTRNKKYAEVRKNDYWRWSLYWKDWDRMNEYHWEYMFSWISPENTLEIRWNKYENIELISGSKD